ncbi:MAG: class I SAM-dependent methyltransferase [Actinomycetota bacterium]
MPNAEPPALDTVLQRVADVDGWMTDGQAAALYEAAAACPPAGTIVEIGSFRGRSTIVLASAAPSDARIYAIDPHAGNDRGPREIDGYADEADDDHQVFFANLQAAGVADRVTHLRMFSDAAHDAVDGSIDVLYIDGAHRYGPARTDIMSWGARVRDGGTLLIHDSFSSVGVTTAIARELLAGRRFRYVGRSRSLAIYRADLEAGDRWNNGARQAAQFPWFARNVALKAALVCGMGRALERTGRVAPEWPY